MLRVMSSSFWENLRSFLPGDLPFWVVEPFALRPLNTISMIDKIQSWATVPVRCIKVDSPRSLTWSILDIIHRPSIFIRPPKALPQSFNLSTAPSTISQCPEGKIKPLSGLSFLSLFPLFVFLKFVFNTLKQL